MKVTGTMINYLFVCRRKLWLFCRHLEMEHNSDKVALGRLLHEEGFQRERRKELRIDDQVTLDFIDRDGILHDVKSGLSMSQAHQMQVLYYLYVLKQKGVPNRQGVINYVKQRRKEEVELTAEKEIQVQTAMGQVKAMANQRQAPPAERLKICRSCSYNELCWS